MAHSVRIGIIGCGSVMQDGYLPIARDLQARGARRRRVVCDSDPGRAALLQMPGQPTFTIDDHAVLADGAVELAPTPSGLPCVDRGSALRPGLATASCPGRQLGGVCTVALAARSPGFLIVAPHIVLSPTYQQIGRFLRQGTIGTVVAARAGRPRLEPLALPGWRRRATLRPRGIQRRRPDRLARPGSAAAACRSRPRTTPCCGSTSAMPRLPASPATLPFSSIAMQRLMSCMARTERSGCRAMIGRRAASIAG